MKKAILSIMTVAALCVGTAGNASAEEITVQAGDTLWDIAKQQEVSVEELQEWNDLTDDTIHPEDKLIIQKFYEILEGDSLWTIAQKHQLSVDDLKKWNNLNTSIIHPGDKLLINHKDKSEKTAASMAPVKKQEIKEVEAAPAKPAEQPTKEETPKAAEQPKNEETAKTAEKVLTVEATAYTANCEGCSGTTKTGIDLQANPDKKVIAVDPNVIPLGSKVHVEGYGEAIAGDIGGGINGHEIDVFIPSESQAKEWGRQKVQVKILE